MRLARRPAPIVSDYKGSDEEKSSILIALHFSRKVIRYLKLSQIMRHRIGERRQEREDIQARFTPSGLCAIQLHVDTIIIFYGIPLIAQE